jgi:hypothetical protein
MTKSAEENDEFETTLKSWLRWIAIVTGVITAIVLAAYFLHFRQWPMKASPKTEDWGLFGDYLGGTLGTFFAFAAFLSVVLTMTLQWRQLRHSEPPLEIR